MASASTRRGEEGLLQWKLTKALRHKSELDAGLPYLDLVRALSETSLTGSHTAQTEKIKGLLSKIDAHSENPFLERFALLKLLLPNSNGNTYGVKTTSMLIAWGKTLGIAMAALRLRKGCAVAAQRLS